MRIAMMTPWGIECGIATYSSHLVAALRKAGHEVAVANGTHDDRGVLHVQHEFGLHPDARKFSEALTDFTSHGPVVLTAHSLSPGGHLFPWFRKLLVVNSVHVIAHTEAACEDLRRTGVPALRVHHVPHGCPVAQRVRRQKARRKLDLPAGKTIALTLGFLSVNKSAHDVLLAVRALVRDNKIDPDKFLYLVVGSPGANHPMNVQYADRLRELAASEDLKRCCRVEVRYVPEDELSLWYSAADFVVNHSGPTVHSTSGRAMREIGFGMPAAAARQLILDVYGDAALRYHGQQELRDAILRLATDADLRRDYAHKAADLGRSLSWDKVAVQHVAVYEKAAADFALTPRTEPDKPNIVHPAEVAP